MKPLDLYYEEDHERISTEIEKAFKGQEANAIARLKKKDESYSWYHLTGTHIEQDEEDYILGTGINISQRIEAEKKLSRKSKLLSKLFENSPIGIALVNSQNDILEINNSFTDMFGYNQREVVSKNIDKLITLNKCQSESKYNPQKLGIGHDNFHEETCKHKEGREVPVLKGVVPIEADGQLNVSYIMYVDITERKKYLEKIKEALNEKKILLQEIHHRVKNNLAIVSSFLQLQKFNTSDEKLHQILLDSEMRIQTMALIHEQLYKTESLSEINVEDYIYKLLNSLKKMHDPEKQIELVIDCSEFDLNVNQAVPCAMIVNELISNSFEHAFKDSEKGEINVGVVENEGKVTIGLKDNGCGLPSGFDPDNTSTLGYTIIKTLVEQLEARIDIESKNGTNVTIVFNKIDTKGSSSGLI